MRIHLTCACVVALSVCQPAIADQPKNLCPNAGFELLNPAGNNFPVDWGGQHNVTIDKNAHSGSVALRLSSKAGDTATVNSAEMQLRRGRVTFYYKAIRSGSDGDNLRMCVIAMAKGTGELTRTTVAIPKAHVGDGQWHQGKLEFDFTANISVDGILLAPRVNEVGKSADGEWLLDDVECVENRLGPRPEIEVIHMPQPIMKIGQPAEIIVQVINNGDAPVPPSKCRLKLSDDVSLTHGPAVVKLDTLKPAASRRITWKIIAQTECNVTILAQMSAADFAEGTIAQSEYRTVCTASDDPRRICTGKRGFWRFMPKPVPIQENNAEPLTPLKTKKSLDLPDSMIGVTAHVPRPRDYEVIFEPEHLIDGNYETNWSARAHRTTACGGADWAEVSFAGPQEIREIRLIPYYRAEGFPADFTVLLHRGKTWITVKEFEGVRIPVSDGEKSKKPFVISLPEPIKADGVRVEVTRCGRPSSFFTEFYVPHYFRLSEIEAVAADGRNVALASNGGKVAVSTTFRSYYNSTEVVRRTFSEMYEMGVKWNRIGQWGDWTCWAIVEREKGKYEIDPVTDAAITESIKNGINILYTLDYGNPLYEETTWLSKPGPVWRHSHPFTGDGGPTKPESIQGFVNYAKFVANHFKGRIKHYEIWNEQNSWAWYGAPPDPKAFGTLLRETAKALKEIDPEIKVMVGGTAALAPTFISQALAEGGGPYLDSIAFHPYTMPYAEMGLGSLDVIDGKQLGRSPADLGFKTWSEMLVFLRKTFEPFNPKFDYWANEWNAIPDMMDGLHFGFGEVAEAKHAARFFLNCTLTEVHGVWWSLANENWQFAWAILRTGDLARKPIFYTIQAMSTLLAGAKPDTSIKAKTVGDVPELRCESLRGPNGEMLIAVWSAVAPQDDVEPRRVTVRIEQAGDGTIELIDTLHAVVQKPSVGREGSTAIIDGVLVMDYPVILRVTPR